MGIFHFILILFLTVPLIEIFLLLEIGSLVGTLATVLLIVGTAVLGIALVRQQSLTTLQRVQLQLQKNELPALEMLEGVVVLIAGALLLTPGFFTDTLGFLCLVPAVRRYFLRNVINRYTQPQHLYQSPPDSNHSERDSDHSERDRSGRKQIIEGECKRDDD